MPKPKPADIQGLTELKNMLQSIKDAATGAVVLAQHVQKSVDDELELGRETVRVHLDRKEVRPKISFKPLPKNQWAIVLGQELYAIGPLPNFAEIDDGVPKFYWRHAEGTPVPIESMFKGLMGIMQHYFNDTNDWFSGMGLPIKHSATAPVINPVDNPTV